MICRGRPVTGSEKAIPELYERVIPTYSQIIGKYARASHKRRSWKYCFDKKSIETNPTMNNIIIAILRIIQKIYKYSTLLLRL